MSRKILQICTVFLSVCSAANAEPVRNDGVTERDSSTAGPKITYREDVVYGRVSGAGLLADIAYPESKTPLAAVVSVHGGRWRGGHKRDRSTFKVKQWAGFGVFAMSIDYRLVGCTPAPACYQDMQWHPAGPRGLCLLVFGATQSDVDVVVALQLGVGFPGLGRE